MAKHKETHEDNPAYMAHQEAFKKLIPDDFVEVDIGFPPYWKADLGKGFRGTVLMRDERDPLFVRYHIENTGPSIDCQKGPTEDGVIETVPTGRIFTTGAFAALPLDRFFGFEVVVMVVGARKLKGNDASRGVARDMWEWRCMVNKETEKILRSQRTEDLVFLKEAQRNAQRKALEEVTRIGAAQRAQSGIRPSLAV